MKTRIVVALAATLAATPVLAQSAKINGLQVTLQPFPTSCDVLWSESPSHILYQNPVPAQETGTFQIVQGHPYQDDTPTDLFNGIKNMQGLEPYAVLVGTPRDGIGAEWDFTTPRNDAQLGWASPDQNEGISLWDANNLLIGRVTGGAITARLTNGQKMAQVNVMIHSEVPFVTARFESHTKGFEFSYVRFDALPQCLTLP